MILASIKKKEKQSDSCSVFLYAVPKTKKIGQTATYMKIIVFVITVRPQKNKNKT